jgi:acyl-[acyl-carrier-protein] desaturase
MKLPARMAISERIVIPQETHLFKWVEPARL